MKRTFFIKLFLLFSLISVLPFFFSWAEEEQMENLEEICHLEEIEQDRELLEKCLDYYEQKSAQLEKDLSKTESEKKTLQNQIYLLRNKIKNLDYQIYQSNLMIKNTGLEIKETETSIEETSSEILVSKKRLAQVLRTIYKENQKGLVEILLAGDCLSDFYDNLMALMELNSKNQKLLQDIKDLKIYLLGERQSLDSEKEELENLVVIQKIQKQKSQETKEDQEYYLELTETDYQKQLKEKQEIEQRAKEIRARIYELIGVRIAVTYQQALEVAKYAASQTGIRPALLLGVLSQESQIGKNVGQCFLKNPSTGEGIVAYNGQSRDRVMKPTRDVAPFLEIIEELNKVKGLFLDPYETLVSCPMSFGWGGAMGPAQFIPSTWVRYKERVEAITKTATDPWDIRDASLAASFYLKDGLDRYGAEGKSVQAYFCGYPKNTYWCKWYEKNVLYLAQCHQDFIDRGLMSEECERAIGLR